MFGFKWCSHCYHSKGKDFALVVFKSDCVEYPFTLKDPNHSWGFNCGISVYVCCKCHKVKFDIRHCMIQDEPYIRKVDEGEIKAFKQEMIEKYGDKK